MKKGTFFKGETIGDFLKHLGITFGALFFIIITYFYLYLPNSTNHGDSIKVPDLAGMPSDKLDSFLKEADLRFEVSDSSFSDSFSPLEVIGQFPKAGSFVKPGRKIHVSINRLHPPTAPLPNLVEQSLINAIATLKSNELKIGKIYYAPSPFSDLVMEMRVNGAKMEGGTRVNKGSVVDLVVGDGAGPNDMRARSVVGMVLADALRLLSAFNLHQGDIIIPEDVDTTGIISYVFRQEPKAGDSVKVGDPVNLWIGPMGYVEKDTVDIANDLKE
jgi:eukaryotic-like serine/threonine-protein kinase